MYTSIYIDISDSQRKITSSYICEYAPTDSWLKSPLYAYQIHISVIIICQYFKIGADISQCHQLEVQPVSPAWAMAKSTAKILFHTPDSGNNADADDDDDGDDDESSASREADKIVSQEMEPV